MNDAILYIDDDNNNLVVFKSAFIDHFEIVTCTSAEEAIEILDTREFPVVIADQRMPGMKGVDILEVVKGKYSMTIRMILTAYTDVGDVLDAINRGNVYKYITKPWRADDLLMTLHRAVEAYHLQKKNQQLAEQLIQAEKFSVLGQFASGMTHEIRNQLGVITFAELIRDEYPDDKRLCRYSEILLQARDHLLGIVSEVRDFSRNSPPDYEMKPTNLVDVAESALSLVRFDKAFKTKEISTMFSDKPVVVMCNDGKIKQVLINLLRNAAHATDDHHPAQITVEVSEQNDFGVIRVSDNGCGIQLENMEKIWEPLFTTNQDSGTGLGLDICKKIVAAHNGRIECDNLPESGAAFTVGLPTKK